MFRLRHLHLYGREVFTEATIDPLKTVNKDVLPRFLVSGFYQDLDRRLKSIVTLPAATDFTVKPPRSSAAMKLNMNHDTLGFLRSLILIFDLPYIAITPLCLPLIASTYL